MNEHETDYQGWTNVQTWCVANTITNEARTQNDVLRMLKRCENNDNATAENALFCWTNINWVLVHDFAPWAWEDCSNLLLVAKTVNWTELVEWFATKLKDGALST